MAENLNFEDWWTDFINRFKNHKDGGRGMLDRLKMEVKNWPMDRREAFIDELLDRNDLEFYACEITPVFGTKKQITALKERAKKSIEGKRNPEIISEYIKVILKTFDSEDIELLTTYYLNDQEAFSFHIPSELFKIDQDLFLKAFTKYLANYSVETLCKYDGLLYLTKNIEAIEFLINRLPADLAIKMKSFARVKSEHSMVVKDKNLSNRLMELGQ